jgi:hypothetical protein
MISALMAAPWAVKHRRSTTDVPYFWDGKKSGGDRKTGYEPTGSRTGKESSSESAKET